MSDVDTAPASNGAAPPPDIVELSGQDLIDAIAQEMGHASREKWKGDPDKYVDSATYLKNTPKVLKSMREQLERSTRAAGQAIERAQRQAIADAEAKIEAAAAAGDAEGAKAATKELQEAARAPDPQVQDFAVRNPWYMTNQTATSVAIAEAQRIADSGGNTAAQCVAAEKEVRKRFPELFGDDEAEEEKPSRSPPNVAGGQRAANAAPRKRGWSDIPAATRAIVTPKILKSFNQTEAEYAEAYWQENG